MGKDKKQTVTQTVDPASQRHIDAMRAMGLQDAQGIQGPMIAGVDPNGVENQMQRFMDPYMEQVLGGVGESFDRSRDLARTQGSQAATAAGAFNSTRHGVAEGVTMGELGRDEAMTRGGILSQGFQQALRYGTDQDRYERDVKTQQLQEPYMRAQMRNSLMAGSLGPTGSTQTSVQKGNLMGDIVGVGLTGLGFMAGGPAGAAAGAKAGFGGGGGGNPLTGFGATPPMGTDNIFSNQWQNPFAVRGRGY